MFALSLYRLDRMAQLLVHQNHSVIEQNNFVQQILPEIEF